MTDIEIAGLKIGGIEVKTPDTRNRISLLLWGPAGCGKTDLACTLPPPVILVSADPDGYVSISHRSDVVVADVSGASSSILARADGDNPLQLKQAIEQIGARSLVFDSLTSWGELALTHGIAVTSGATNERPSPGAYQVRNRYTLLVVRNVLRLTSRLNVHCCFTAHEADPKTDKQGNVLYITVMLGGQLPNQSSMNFSEVWNMTDTGKQRRISVRQARMRQPMKSRMYHATAKNMEFNVPEHGPEDSPTLLADEYARWEANEFRKIALPTSTNIATTAKVKK